MCVNVAGANYYPSSNLYQNVNLNLTFGLIALREIQNVILIYLFRLEIRDVYLYEWMADPTRRPEARWRLHG